jgi:hypothetical protein
LFSGAAAISRIYSEKKRGKIINKVWSTRNFVWSAKEKGEGRARARARTRSGGRERAPGKLSGFCLVNYLGIKILLQK